MENLYCSAVSEHFGGRTCRASLSSGRQDRCGGAATPPGGRTIRGDQGHLMLGGGARFIKIRGD